MKQLADQVFDLMMKSGVPFSIYKGENYIIEFANETALQVAGKTSEIIGKPIIEIIPEVEAQGYIQLLDQVRQTGKPYRAYEAPITLLINGTAKELYLNFTYQPIVDEETGAVDRILSLATDVTEQVLARKKLEESQQQFRNVLEQAPSPILILKGKDLTLEAANEPLLKLWNVGPEAIGKPLLEMLPEMKEQGFYDLLQNVYQNGEPYFGYETPVYFVRQGSKKELHYFNFEYQPYKEKDGTITGILVLATDVTEQLITRQKAEESQQHFRSLVMQAPIGMCILKGNEFVVEMVNNSYLEIIQRKRDQFEGKPLWDGIPEVKDQGFDTLLNNVLHTGNGFTGKEFEATLQRNGKAEKIYIDFVYEPLQEAGKSIERILVLAIDVTDKVLARKKIEEAEESSRLAIEAAELGTFEIDLQTNLVISSIRLKEIFDVDSDKDRDRFVSAIHPEDLAIRNEAYTKAFKTGALEYEGRIISKDDSIRWIKVKGKVSFNEDGQPVRLLGLVQEITEQKLFAEELKRQVDEQTNELSHANSELKKINQELEQFAYISSHDLQEPLRKIKMFSSMILERDGNQLSDYSKSKFSKVVDAADRMSRSLRDLLNYASTGKEVAAEAVDLNEVVKMVENDLELMISQKNAIIKTEGLPLTTAIPLQMHQLFYNLINNALKFSKADVPPIIEISCQSIQKSTNQSTKTYYQIKVQDNGIGFEAYGVDKIFGIFQRMHDRHTYDGTGIGLALCKKVVENHDGEIFATAVPGQGACFTILLPQ